MKKIHAVEVKRVRMPNSLKTVQQPTHTELTVLDHSVPPCYIMFSWVFSKAAAPTFEMLCTGLEGMLNEPVYAQILARDYIQDSDGRWNAHGYCAETVLAVQAVAPELDFDLTPPHSYPGPLLPQKEMDPWPDAWSGVLFPSPVFVVQHTTVANGMCIVNIALHHCIADGCAFFGLARDLAAFCRGEKVKSIVPNEGFTFKSPLQPNNMKTASAAFVYAKSSLPEWLRRSMAWLIRRPGRIIASLVPAIMPPMEHVRLHFSSETLARLKAQGERLSSNDVICGAVWAAVTRARAARLGAAKMPDRVQLACAVSLRGRRGLDPALPEGFFGNSCLFSWASAPRGEVAGESRGSHGEPEGGGGEGRSAGRLADAEVVRCAQLVRASVEAMDAAAVAAEVGFLQAAPRKQLLLNPFMRSVLSPALSAVSNWAAFDTRLHFQAAASSAAGVAAGASTAGARIGAAAPNAASEGLVYAGLPLFSHSGVDGIHVITAGLRGGLDLYLGALAADVPSLLRDLAPFSSVLARTRQPQPDSSESAKNLNLNEAPGLDARGGGALARASGNLSRMMVASSLCCLVALGGVVALRCVLRRS